MAPIVLHVHLLYHGPLALPTSPFLSNSDMNNEVNKSEASQFQRLVITTYSYI